MAINRLQVERALPVVTSDEIAIANVSNETVASTATGTTVGKLIDSSVDFNGQNKVEQGFIVQNMSTSGIAKVESVDDANTLTLSSDIITSGNEYKIFSKATNGCLLYIGVSGDLSIKTSGGDNVIYKGVDVGFLPVHVSQVYQTGTTATDIIANW